MAAKEGQPMKPKANLDDRIKGLLDVAFHLATGEWPHTLEWRGGLLRWPSLRQAMLDLLREAANRMAAVQEEVALRLADLTAAADERKAASEAERAAVRQAAEETRRALRTAAEEERLALRNAAEDFLALDPKEQDRHFEKNGWLKAFPQS
jgi:hypothetical protein